MQKTSFLKSNILLRSVISVLFGSSLFYSGMYTPSSEAYGIVDSKNSTSDLGKIILSDYPIYQTINSRLINERVISTNPLQIEQNIVENANLTNVGNVTNL